MGSNPMLLFTGNIIYLGKFLTKKGISFFLPVTQKFLDITSILCGFFLIDIRKKAN